MSVYPPIVRGYVIVDSVITVLAKIGQRKPLMGPARLKLSYRIGNLLILNPLYWL